MGLVCIDYLYYFPLLEYYLIIIYYSINFFIQK